MTYAFHKHLTTALLTISALPTAHADYAALNVSGAIPEISAYARPLTASEFKQYLNPILEDLKSQCVTGRKIPNDVRPLLQEVCTLHASWDHLQKVTATLKNPQESSMRFSEAVTNPHLDQLYAGTWRKNLKVDQSGKSASEIASEIMLTKVIVQKSLTAYGEFAVFLSKDKNNTAKTYIIPKLVQSLEGRTIIGGLLERYKSQTCSIKQSLAKPGTDLCFVEKLRTAAVVHDLYSISRPQIERIIRLISTIGAEGDKASLRQLTMIAPLNLTLRNANSSTERADVMWSDLKKRNSKWQNAIEQDIKNLTNLPVQLANQDQVSAYIYLSALIATKDLQDLSTQIEVLAGHLRQYMPKVLSGDGYKKLQVMSKDEIQALTSGITLFVEDQEWEMKN